MTMTNAGNNYKFHAIMNRRSNIQEVQLRKIKKDGKPGTIQSYRLYGSESTAADVIVRLMNNNPGHTWIEE